MYIAYTPGYRIFRENFPISHTHKARGNQIASAHRFRSIVNVTHARASPRKTRARVLLRGPYVHTCINIARVRIYLQSRTHMAPVTAHNAFVCMRAQTQMITRTACLTINAHAFGYLIRKEPKGIGGAKHRGNISGVCVANNIATRIPRRARFCHGATRRGVNLGVNVSRRETSLVRRIDYGEDADMRGHRPRNDAL